MGFSDIGSIVISAPIFRQGEFAGILGWVVDLSKVNERYITPIHSGATGGAWMISQEGKFVAHYDPSMLGKDAFLTRKEQNPASPPNALTGS